MNDTTNDFQERDFIFAGCRRSALNGDLFDALVVDGRELHFGRKSARSAFVIGGIYRGASFNAAGTVRGFNRQSVTFVGRHENADDVIAWEATDGAARRAHEAAKFERDAKKVSEIATILLPLRRAYWQAAKVGDFAKAQAIEIAVRNALTRPITKAEEQHSRG